MQKQQQTGAILANRRLTDAYFQVDLHAPRVAPLVRPGQFVHVRMPALEHRLLRRPFSVFNVEPGTGRLSIIYKVVGEGTRHLAALGPDEALDVLGPLGVGFTLPGRDAVRPVIVAGGYGAAATYLLARRSPVPCLCLLGGRTAEDVLLQAEFEALGCAVRLATDDGSAGHAGVVTELLEAALDEGGTNSPIYACGPNPMLREVARILLARGLDAEVSLDHVMCCGVGACFACVVKMRAENEAGWEYVRTCLDGPVFRASRIYWE